MNHGFVAPASLAACALALSLPLAAQDRGAGASMHGPGSGMHAQDQNMHGMMMQSMREMNSVPMSGDQDRDFAMMMQHHHDGGIRMAEAQLQNGKDPALKELARKILEGQRKEKAELASWQQKHSR
jgi:uncharacterized protein (DUF305 family)